MTTQGAILIVDDEQFIRQILVRTVRRAGFAASEAADGVEALARMEEQPYDIVITDVSMPNMDGFELLGKVRDLYPDTLVILITGHKKLMMPPGESGHRADAFISKPFHNVEITRQLQLLYQARQMDTARRQAESGDSSTQTG